MLSVWIAYGLLSLVIGYFAARQAYREADPMPLVLSWWGTVALAWPLMLLVLGLIAASNYVKDHGVDEAVGRALFGKR